METFRGEKTLRARSRSQWRRWLTAHHQSDAAIWLIIFHKGSRTPSVHFQEAIEEAICFGWIDSKGRKRSGDSFYLRFSRRNPRSSWGKSSRERAARMLEAGLMTEAGRAMIDLARRTGRWEENLDAENLVVPRDLAAALRADAAARKNFEDFPPSSRRIVLAWIGKARKPETRLRRIARAAELARANVVAGLPRAFAARPARRS